MPDIPGCEHYDDDPDRTCWECALKRLDQLKEEGKFEWEYFHFKMDPIRTIFKFK